MRNIYVLDEDDELKIKMVEIFKKEKENKIKRVSVEDLHKAMSEMPDLYLVNEDAISKIIDPISIYKKIRDDIDNARTPIVVLSSNEDNEHVIEILKHNVELFLPNKVDERIIYHSINNLLRLLNSNRMVSPLTGLPGNVQIQAEMKKRLTRNKDFALLYLDLDNFKAYNDTYGFSNGDEIIKFTARIIMKNVMGEENEDNFVGHIGGDDFVAITNVEDCEVICQNIIAEFDKQVTKYFDDSDIERGYIEVENRKGIMEQFPIVSISIGVVEVNKERFKNTLEIGEAGANVKHLAKTIWGSTYVIDRRKNRDENFDKAQGKKINKK